MNAYLHKLQLSRRGINTTAFVLFALLTPAVTNAAPVNSPLPIRSVSLMSSAPINDPLQLLAPQSAAYNGKLVYTSYVPYKGVPSVWWRHYLVLRNLGKGTGHGAPVLTKYLQVKVPFWLFDPQISPDDQHVLFKFGDPFGGPNASYGFFLWNLVTGDIRPGPKKTLRYRKLSWSPSGRYIAFIEGGDADGNTRHSSQVLRLYVYDVKMQKIRLVVQSHHTPEFEWTFQDTLLFAALPQDINKEGSKLQSQLDEKQADKSINGSSQNRLPYNIYEVTASGSQPLLLLENSTVPQPSPDGRWLMLRSYSLTSETGPLNTRSIKETGEESISQLQSYLYDRVEKKRYIVPVSVFAQSELRWTPDSKHLIEVKQNISKPGTATVSTLDVTKRIMTKIVTLQAKNRVSSAPYAPLFQIMSISKDSKTLFVKISEFGSPQDSSGILDRFNLLKAVSLSDGTSSTLVETKNDTGLDWNGTSTPVTIPTKTITGKVGKSPSGF